MRSAYCHCRHQTRSMRRSSRCLIGTAGSVCPARVSVKRPREEVEALHHLAAGAGHRATARCGMHTHRSSRSVSSSSVSTPACPIYRATHQTDPLTDGTARRLSLMRAGEGLQLRRRNTGSRQEAYAVAHWGSAVRLLGARVWVRRIAEGAPCDALLEAFDPQTVQVCHLRCVPR